MIFLSPDQGIHTAPGCLPGGDDTAASGQSRRTAAGRRCEAPLGVLDPGHRLGAEQVLGQLEAARIAATSHQRSEKARKIDTLDSVRHDGGRRLGARPDVAEFLGRLAP